MIFWTAAIWDADADLHWSSIIWGDDFSAADVMTIAEREWDEDIPAGCRLEVHGPFTQGEAAATKEA